MNTRGEKVCVHVSASACEREREREKKERERWGWLYESILNELELWAGKETI